MIERNKRGLPVRRVPLVSDEKDDQHLPIGGFSLYDEIKNEGLETALKVMEKAPAKINLSLDVLKKRADGYHEVRMVMTTVDLTDRLECSDLREDRIVLHASAPFVPEDEHNLAYRAARLIKEMYGIHHGVHIDIQKKIPVAAGLAGGSSDAAATIRALNRLWSLGMQDRDMRSIAEQIGSDVVFCLKGGTALATGRGECIEQLPGFPPCWVILVKPDVSVSTAAIYRAWNGETPLHPNVDAMVAAIRRSDFPAVCRLLGNALEPVTMRTVPEIARIKRQLRLIGAEGVLMSGSGPTVFALTRNESRLPRLLNGMQGYGKAVFAACPYHASPSCPNPNNGVI